MLYVIEALYLIMADVNDLEAYKLSKVVDSFY